MTSKYYGTVTRVIDGDTFQVKDKFGNTQTIRLFGVDTPERKQPFGRTATEYTRNLIEKQEVYVQSIELGKYGRVVAIVKINDRSVAEMLLMDGIAFASGSNHRLAQSYYALQEKARVNNQGLWKLGIQDPALFRKQNQKIRNPSFAKSGRPDPIPVPRFRPEKPKMLDTLKSFFTGLLEKNEEQAQKRAEIKKVEKERIEKRIADRKLENDIKEKLEKRQQEEDTVKPVDIEQQKANTQNVINRFRERSKNM